MTVEYDLVFGVQVQGIWGAYYIIVSGKTFKGLWNSQKLFQTTNLTYLELKRLLSVSYYENGVLLWYLPWNRAFGVHMKGVLVHYKEKAILA